MTETTPVNSFYRNLLKKYMELIVDVESIDYISYIDPDLELVSRDMFTIRERHILRGISKEVQAEIMVDDMLGIADKATMPRYRPGQASARPTRTSCPAS